MFIHAHPTCRVINLPVADISSPSRNRSPYKSLILAPSSAYSMLNPSISLAIIPILSSLVKCYFLCRLEGAFPTNCINQNNVYSDQRATGKSLSPQFKSGLIRPEWKKGPKPDEQWVKVKPASDRCRVTQLTRLLTHVWHTLPPQDSAEILHNWTSIGKLGWGS